MRIPPHIFAGDSASWLDDASVDTLGNPLDSGAWTLSYSIRGATTLDLTGTPSGTGWKTSITTAQSIGLTPGEYFWQAYATNGDDRVTLGSGQLRVLQNAQTASSGFDGRTQTKKDLDAVELAIRSMIAGGAVQEYSVSGRSLKRMEMASLLQLQSRLKTRYFREQKSERIANGLGNPGSVSVRFK